MTQFMPQEMLGTPLGVWVGFFGLIALLMALDLGLLHRKNRIIGGRESLIQYAGYMSVGLLFGLFVYYLKGPESALDYYTALVVEQSLSLDNIFVISVIFSFFAIPRAYQHRVLFWGIIGVILLRGLLIGFGTVIIAKFSWILFIFAALLMYTGVKLFFHDAGDLDLGKSKIILFLKKYLNVTPDLKGDKFFVREQAEGGQIKTFATPLFLALITVELADVLFAFDSVPAVFAITTDTFVVFTSNLFAILGLRTLYFALSAILHRFVYLKYALSAVLIFIGGKVFYAHLFGKVPPLFSLTMTITILVSGVLYSLYRTAKESDSTTS